MHRKIVQRTFQTNLKVLLLCEDPVYCASVALGQVLQVVLGASVCDWKEEACTGLMGSDGSGLNQDCWNEAALQEQWKGVQDGGLLQGSDVQHDGVKQWMVVLGKQAPSWTH